jgi:hypothetical protein
MKKYNIVLNKHKKNDLKTFLKNMNIFFEVSEYNNDDVYFYIEMDECFENSINLFLEKI